MKNFITFISFIFTIQLSGQKVMSLLVPQNITIKSQDIWYGIYLHGDNLKEINVTASPVFIQVALHDRNGIQYYRTQHKMSTNHLASTFQLPPNTKADSYVLSATIYNSDVSSILAESSTLLHVIDESTSQVAEIEQGNLKTCEENNCTITPNTVMLIKESEQKSMSGGHHTRDKICMDGSSENSSQNSFLMTSNSLFNFNKAELYYQSNTLANYQTLFTSPYTIKTTMPIGTGFFDVAEKKFYQLKKQTESKLYLLQTDRTINTLHTQLLDILYNVVVDEVPVMKYPTPFWKSATLKNSPYDLNLKNTTIKKLESIFIVNGSINPNMLNVSSPAQTTTAKTEIVPDETYIMANYQPFESIHLFLYEAVAPIKSIKKETGFDLKMVNLRTKSLFPESPVILIDGKISDVQDVYKLEYSQLKRMNIYRELNTTRSTFGSIAKNGILEIITKKGLDLSKENLFKIHGPSPNYEFNELNIVNKQNIYVYPFVHFGKNTQNCFQHGDDIGKFNIKLYNAKGTSSFVYDVDL